MIAQLSSPNRWTKNWVEYKGKRCLYGALHFARTGCAVTCGLGRIADDPVHGAMIEEAEARGFTGGFSSAVYFNNALETTHADILDFLACVRRRLETPGVV